MGLVFKRERHSMFAWAGVVIMLFSVISDGVGVYISIHTHLMCLAHEYMKS